MTLTYVQARSVSIRHLDLGFHQETRENYVPPNNADEVECVWKGGGVGVEAKNSIAERQHVPMTYTHCYACTHINSGVIRVPISSAITRGKTTEVQSGFTKVAARPRKLLGVHGKYSASSARGGLHCC